MRIKFIQYPTYTDIPFNLHDRPGTIRVTYGITRDPAGTGFDILPGLPFDPCRCNGYPTLQAEIIRYKGTGYRGLAAWIQLVTNTWVATHAPDAKRKTSVSMDLPPVLEGVKQPFVSFGLRPSFYDAPCMNRNGQAEMTWVADTFLVTFPLRSRAEGIARLAGFRWGYVETDAPDSRPRLLPLEITGAEDWNDHLATLRRNFKDWIFLEDQ